MIKKQMIKTKITAFFLTLLLIFTMAPQPSYAGSNGEGSISWDWWFGSSTTGNQVSTEYFYYDGMDLEDVGFKISDPSVVPEITCRIEDYGPGYAMFRYTPAKAGTTEVTLYDKNNPEITSTTETITVSERAREVYVGESIGLSYGEFFPALTFQYTVDDESIVSVTDEGIYTGKKVGETTIHVFCEQDPSVEITIPVEVTEDPSGIYYKDDKVDKLEWSKEQGTLKIKVIDGKLHSAKDHTSNTFFDSSNTEIAEMEYKEGSNGLDQATGNVILKKNGTVTINAYQYATRLRSELLGTLTIKVTGFAEDAPPAKWEAVNGPQYGYENGGFAELTNHSIENNILNETIFQNQIINQIPAGNAEFSVKLGYSKPNIDFEMDSYLAEILPEINICKVREDGTRGEVVASYNKGYTVQKEDITTEEGWSGSQGSGVAKVTLPIQVNSDVLEKGKTYVLVLDRTVHPPVSGAPLQKDFEYQFTTMGGATSIELDRASASIKPGETLTLTAEMNKGESVEADDTVSWKSSNESVATVDQKGTVTAKKPGTATITATAVDGKVSAKCEITVEPIKSSDITLSTRAATLNVGKTLTLKATVYPTNASNKTVTWSSSNPKVATVNASGKVTGKKAGTAVITAKTADGLTVSATITVKNVKVKGVKLNVKKVTRTVGKTKQLKATVRPAGATNKKVTWKSSNKKVARVNAKGKVTAKSPGKATITVTTKDGKYKAKAVIQVKPKNVSRFTLAGNSRSVVVKYKKRSGIDGYQIYRSEKKKGGYDRVTTRTKKQAGRYTSIGVKANRTYYYKMRTYKVVKGKKIYSSFSQVKKVSTK